MCFSFRQSLDLGMTSIVKFQGLLHFVLMDVGIIFGSSGTKLGSVIKPNYFLTSTFKNQYEQISLWSLASCFFS